MLSGAGVRAGPVRAVSGRAGRVMSVCYCLLFFFLSQILMEYLMPLNLVYHDRVEFEILKDNPADIDCVLDLIKKTVDRAGISEYFIILGDSVAYSGPGGPEQSVSRYMNDIARERGLPPVFNLAVPAAQAGDFYTLLLKLEEKGISTDNVIINLIYGGFVKRDPRPPVVYWFYRDLERLDPETYEAVRLHLEQARAAETGEKPRKINEKIQEFLQYRVFPVVPVLKYRDFIRDAIFRKAGVPRTTGDARPWYEKPYLPGLLKQAEYQRLFSPEPVVLDGTNPNVFFLKKIAERQRGKNLFVFMSPVNSELMKEEVSRPGYKQNLNEINAFMGQLARDYSFHYRDLSDAIPQELFSDHLHLVSGGYQRLAEILWDWVETANQGQGERRE